MIENVNTNDTDIVTNNVTENVNNNDTSIVTGDKKLRPNYNLSEDTIEKIEKISDILGYKKAEFVDIYLNGTLELGQYFSKQYSKDRFFKGY